MALAIGMLAWFLASRKEEAPLRYLPYFGPKNFSGKNDTIYHVIPTFSFTDQRGEKFISDSVKGKIYVAEYFFTTCKSICPIMNRNLETIYREFGNRSDFRILSHTVDPENDSVKVLLNYAISHGVKDAKWKFLTGDKKELYALARKGYLLDASEGNGDEEDFVHTQNFALVDMKGRIRGFYDGTDSAEIQRLIQDLRVLIAEKDFSEKK